MNARPAQAHLAHQALHGAPGHRDVLSSEMPPDLVRAVDAVIAVRPGASDLQAQLVVALRTRWALSRVGPRSSSAWAKNVDALRRISFARFSSRTSRSSSFSRSRSPVVSPAVACPRRAATAAPRVKYAAIRPPAALSIPGHTRALCTYTAHGKPPTLRSTR